MPPITIFLYPYNQQPMHATAYRPVLATARKIRPPIPLPIDPSLECSSSSLPLSVIHLTLTSPPKTSLLPETNHIPQLNRTCTLVSPSPGCRPVGCKWVFRLKFKQNGVIDRHKARLVLERDLPKRLVLITLTLSVRLLNHPRCA